MSATIKISVAMDRKAALLAGLVVGERETIEVSPETIGADLWPALVEWLDMSKTPPALSGVSPLPAATVEALLVELARARQSAADEAAVAARVRSEEKAAIAAMMARPFAPAVQHTRSPWTHFSSGPAVYPTDHEFAGVTLTPWNFSGAANQFAYPRVDAENSRLFAEAVAANKVEWEAQDAALRAKEEQAERDAEAAAIADREAKITMGEILIIRGKDREVFEWVVEDGYTSCSCPSRGSSWLATVWGDRSQKSGLGRTFWERGQRGWRAIPEDLALGDYVEHGQKDKKGRPQDYDYYRVLAIEPGRLVVREANKPGLAPPPVGPEIEAAHLVAPAAHSNTPTA